MRNIIGDSWLRRDQPFETSYPSLAAPIGNTLSVGGWTWTSYAQIIGSTPYDFVASYAALGLIPVVQVAGAGKLNSLNGEVEFATGAAGSEVAFATIPFATSVYEVSPGTSTQTFFGLNNSYPIGPKFIPAGTRIAIRSRMNLAATDINGYTRAYLIGYDGGKAPVGYPQYTLRGQQTGIQKGTSTAAPAGSTLSVTGGSSAWGSWAEILASAIGDVLLMAMTAAPAVGNVTKWVIFEVGTGAVGAEVSRARLFFPAIYYCCSGIHFFHRPLWVKSGERLAIRAYTGASDVFNCQFLYEAH